MHFLADVYGPRLTGSPNHKAAADWAVKQMTSWGILECPSRAVGVRSSRLGQRARRGPHRFADEERAGRAAAGLDAGHQRQRDRHRVQPGRARGRCPSANAGAADAAAALGPTQAELTAYLDGIKAKVGGAAVLVGKPAFVPVNFNAEATRLSDIDAKCRYSPDAATDPECQGTRADADSAAAARPRRPAPTDRLTARQVNTQIDDFLVANQAALRIDDAGPLERHRHRAEQPHLRRAPGSRRRWSCATTTSAASRGSSPTARPSTLGFNIVNKWYPEGHTSYNTIGEIAGTDKKDEVVMLGGHLDSWHVGHRRDRQRDRLRGDDGSGAHPPGARRPAAPHDPRRAVERRGGRPAGIARLRRAAFRHRRETRSRSSRSSTPT